jgi:glycosyltransferase involved in cell wall biosynthesis
MRALDCRTLWRHIDSVMPPITALLHTKNDAPRLGRALEMLLPCAELLIVDHHSSDATLRIAREYGAHTIPADKTAPAEHYLAKARHDWIFCLAPSESISEGLQATLYEWASSPTNNTARAAAYAVTVREQVSEIWQNCSTPEVRLIPRNWTRWQGWLPGSDPTAKILEGQLLRIAFP